MTLASAMMESFLSSKLPGINAKYCWNVSWLYEDEDSNPPHNINHSDPQKALNHMIEIFNAPRTLVHISISRRLA